MIAEGAIHNRDGVRIAYGTDPLIGSRKDEDINLQDVLAGNYSKGVSSFSPGLRVKLATLGQYRLQSLPQRGCGRETLHNPLGLETRTVC